MPTVADELVEDICDLYPIFVVWVFLSVELSLLLLAICSASRLSLVPELRIFVSPLNRN